MPALNWTPGPAATKSYAITFIDTTLSTGTGSMKDLGYHWAIYNIPASTTSLPEGLTDAGTVGAKQTGAFLGPCPNFGTAPPTGPKTDNYEFTIYALTTESLTLTGGQATAQVKDAEAKLEALNVPEAKLTGKSNAANTM